MKIYEAIHIAERMNPDQFAEEDKIRWLQDLDTQIWHDILRGRIGAPSMPPHYDCIDDELLVKEPYAEEVYSWYIILKGAAYNNEIDRYQNAQVLFNNALASFQGWLIRTHRLARHQRFRM